MVLENKPSEWLQEVEDLMRGWILLEGRHVQADDLRKFSRYIDGFRRLTKYGPTDCSRNLRWRWGQVHCLWKLTRFSDL